MLLEGDRIGWAASGRNGGFCAASLTHGEANGRERFPHEYPTLERMGLENLDAIEATVARYGIDCDFRRTGEPGRRDRGPPGRRAARARRGRRRRFLDRDAVRAEVRSPTYSAGVWDRERHRAGRPRRTGVGPGRGGRGGRRAGARAHDRRRRRARPARGLALRTANGRHRAGRPGRPGHQRVPVPAAPAAAAHGAGLRLRPDDRAAVRRPSSARSAGRHRQGIGDSANQFHYYRLTADNRILWGGYDAIYHFGRTVRPGYDQRPATFHTLAAHFFETFPQLEGLRFTHRWGGAIDTCTRFFAFYGTAFSGRAAYALGYTGLGVGASRFGADVMLDLLSGERTERTELESVRRKPLPFPPEPLAFAGIQATRWSLQQADRNEGRRNLWLRTLDRAGLGFDS